jgi:hypothetical protein
MSEAPLAIRGPAWSSLIELERRFTLAESGPPSFEDQMDWVPALLSQGLESEAKTLIRSVIIQQGVSARRLEVLDQQGLLPLVGLSCLHPAQAALAPSTVELALAELRVLARQVGPEIAARVARASQRDEPWRGLHAAAVPRRAAPLLDERSLAVLVEDIANQLVSSPVGADNAKLESALDSLAGAGASPGSIGCFAGAPHPLLAEAMALASLRRFLVATADIRTGLLGSTRLFHAVARLDDLGLGPYFRNVAQIASCSADVFELAGAAAEAAGHEDLAHVQAWVALLSREIEEDLLDEVVDDLGDQGASFAMSVILERTLERSDLVKQAGLVARLRDAALDNLDYVIAARAQKALVRWRPDDLLELSILGTIDASGRRFAAAEQVFTACLELASDSQDIHAKRDAVRARDFGAFAITRGLGSPPDRQLHRLHRRAAQTGAIRA